MARITLDGNPCDTNGELPAVGSQAPDFRLVGTDLQDVSLSNFKRKKKILSIVPSLETAVCAAQARTFNQKAGSIPGTAVLVVSADLPFSQKRFCEQAGVENAVTLSMMRSRNFAKDYGVLITSGPWEGISARAVVVLDENDRVLHSQLVREIGHEPDYESVLEVLGA
jgi:thiol peroxidase